MMECLKNTKEFGRNFRILMTNFIQSLPFLGAAFNWKVVMIYISSLGVWDHRKCVVIKHPFICHGIVLSSLGRIICHPGTEHPKG